MNKTLAAVGVGVVLLAGFLVYAVSSARICGGGGSRAQSRIQGLRTALYMYHGDHGVYPRGQTDDPYADQAADLHDALMVSGRNAPYLSLRAEEVGVDDEDRLVLLDPWGNPYHYREWASRRGDAPWPVYHARKRNPAVAGRPDVVQHEVIDTTHDPEGFDIWSNGPNGINEYGAPCCDDVTHWDKEDDWANTCVDCILGTAPGPQLGAAVGMSSLLGLIAIAMSLLRRRRRRVAARRSSLHPPQSYAAHVRCVWCHSADGEPMAACLKCRTLLHPDCWTRMRRCPTLGCGQAARRRARVVIPARAGRG